MRKRIKTNSVTIVIEQVAEQERKRELRNRMNHAEVVTDIMQEAQCSWEEAKRIWKFKRVEKAIARELQKI